MVGKVTLILVAFFVKKRDFLLKKVILSLEKIIAYEDRGLCIFDESLVKKHVQI